MGVFSSIGKVLGSGSLGMFGLSTAASMGDAIYGAYAQKKADKKAYERQIALMDMQNAYNTPAAQMQRYAEAGLNPNLIYSQSNLSASPAAVSHGSPQPRTNIADSVMSGMSLAQRKEAMQLQHRYDALKMAQDLVLGQSQLKSVQAAIDLSNARAKAINTATELLLGRVEDTPSGMDPNSNGTVSRVLRFLKHHAKEERSRPKNLNDVTSDDYLLAVMAGEI